MFNLLKKIFISFCVVINLSFVSFAIAALPTVDDFEYTSALSEAKTSLRQFHLPIEAYEKMYRHDLGDLRIFSAEGQLVPHQLSRTKTVSSTQISNLTYYPFDKTLADDAGNISIEINQNTGKQQLKINKTLGQSNKTKFEYQYIIENSHSDNQYPSLCKMKLYWQQNKPSLILVLKLESSDDLQNWRSLSGPLNVSRLNYGKSQLVRDEIEFKCTSQPYVRLTWLNQNDSAESQVHLTTIQGFYSAMDTPQTQWQSFAKPKINGDGDWKFESNVVASLAKMKFVAPQNGLLYKGQLYSRNNSKHKWRPRKQITQYRLKLSESELESNPFSLGGITDRYWKFEPSIEIEHTEAQLPEIKASWSPNIVSFIAQGNPPFKLGLGNPNILPTAYNQLNELIKSLRESGSDVDSVTVAEFINHEKSFSRDGKTNWKKIALWFVLLLGTLLMAFMAYRLFQQMGNESKKS